jgi:hypothetical protein
LTIIITAISIDIAPSVAQDAEPLPIPSPAQSAANFKEGLYFADVEVRGRPIF